MTLFQLWAIGEVHSNSAHGLFLSLFSPYELHNYVNKGCSYLCISQNPATLGAVLTFKK